MDLTVKHPIFSEMLNLSRYRELIKTLVLRDLKIRYRNSVLGYAWTWLDPLLTMFIFILVFDVILSIKVDHFPVYLLSGLIPWVFFSSSVSGSINSITGNAGLIKRVYYPREIFPLTVTLSNGINLLLSLLVLIPVILAFGLKFKHLAILLPIPIFFLFLFTFGLSLMFSCLNVFFRDMTYVGPFIIRLWFYLTPIFYAIEGRIPEHFLDIYMMLNPLSVILALFRTTLMGYPLPAVKHIVFGLGLCSGMFLAGYAFFKKNEDLMVKRI